VEGEQHNLRHEKNNGTVGGVFKMEGQLNLQINRVPGDGMNALSWGEEKAGPQRESKSLIGRRGKKVKYGRKRGMTVEIPMKYSRSEGERRQKTPRHLEGRKFQD